VHGDAHGGAEESLHMRGADSGSGSALFEREVLARLSSIRRGPA
jgi:hypothetical protein